MEEKLVTTSQKSHVSVNTESNQSRLATSSSKNEIKGNKSIRIFKKSDQGVPFQHHLSNPLKNQDLIIVEGFILKHGLRFTINLGCGSNEIAFHLNPRLDQNYIARNTYINGQWGEEEGFGLMKNPLQSGKHFQIQIFVTRDNYLVCINGYHMFAFAHRIPPQSVEKVEIFGDIDLKTVSLMNSDNYPNKSVMKHERIFNSLHIPVTHILEQNLKSGSKIEIQGKIKMLPVSFRINLQSSDEVYPHPLIIYHLNVRYTPDCYIVQNTWGYTGERWDQEIRSSLPLSLSPGKDFEMNICFYDSYIVVKGDAWSLPHFKQRMSLDNTTCIYIQGDIELNKFQITPFRNKEEQPSIANA